MDNYKTTQVSSRQCQSMVDKYNDALERLTLTSSMFGVPGFAVNNSIKLLDSNLLILGESSSAPSNEFVLCFVADSALASARSESCIVDWRGDCTATACSVARLLSLDLSTSARVSSGSLFEVLLMWVDVGVVVSVGVVPLSGGAIGADSETFTVLLQGGGDRVLEGGGGVLEGGGGDWVVTSSAAVLDSSVYTQQRIYSGAKGEPHIQRGSPHWICADHLASKP